MSPDNTDAEPRSIVVRIDGETLRDEAIAREIALLVERYAKLMPAVEIDDIADRILDDAIENAIERHLLLRAARAEVGPPSDDLVDAAVAQWRRNQADRGGGEAPLADPQLGPLREHVRDELTLSRYYDRICADVPRPSTDDCRQWYAEHPDMYRSPERVRVSLIMRATQPNESPLAATAALLNARERLLRGDRFVDVARDVSDAANGGDIGWVDEQTASPLLWNEIARLAPGEISEVFAIGPDRFLAVVEERQASGLKPFSEVWRSIEDELFTARKNLRIGEVVDSLRPSAKIEIKRRPLVAAPAGGRPGSGAHGDEEGRAAADPSA